MAKVKKMAFGGPSFNAPKPQGMAAPRSVPTQAPPGMNAPRPPGSIPEYAQPYMQQRPQGGSQPMQSQMQQARAAQQMAQLRGSMGGSKVPGSGLQALDPNIAKAMQAYQAQPGQGAGVPDYAKPYISQAGQATTPPAFKSMAGMAGAMKKGGAVKAKAYAKGGKVSSASKRGDGIAVKGKTKGRMV